MEANEAAARADTQNANSTDEAIGRCVAIIQNHRGSASFLLIILLIISLLFLAIVGYPKLVAASKATQDSRPEAVNRYQNKINEIDKLSFKQYDSLVTKAIVFQKLINENKNLAKDSSVTSSSEQVGNYLMYGFFILVFGVVSSLYRFHLKEITKQEHFLIGFQRIRIAGQNSSTKYDNEVLTALTKDAFSQESVNISKNVKVESPIPGHPTSDIATTILNKILDKIEVVIPNKQTP